MLGCSHTSMPQLCSTPTTIGLSLSSHSLQSAMPIPALGRRCTLAFSFSRSSPRIPVWMIDLHLPAPSSKSFFRSFPLREFGYAPLRISGVKHLNAFPLRQRPVHTLWVTTPWPTCSMPSLVKPLRVASLIGLDTVIHQVLTECQQWGRGVKPGVRDRGRVRSLTSIFVAPYLVS